MPIMFGAHSFYNLNNGPTLALFHNPILNTQYRHGLPNSILKTTTFSQVTGKGNIIKHIKDKLYVNYCGKTWLGDYVMAKHNFFTKNPSSKIEYF